MITDLYYSLKRQIISFFYYGWKLRNVVSWDSHGLYLMTYVHLDRIYKVFKKDKLHCWVDDKKQMRKLIIAKELAKRLYEENFNEHFSLYLDQYLKKNNLSSDKVLVILNERTKQERLLSKIAINRDQSKLAHHKVLLEQILTKYHDNWWV